MAALTNYPVVAGVDPLLPQTALESIVAFALVQPRFSWHMLMAAELV